MANMNSRIIVVALALGFPSEVVGQSPGNGISKSTYSCTDPVSGYNFLTKYFPASAPSDECSNNICTCPASGSNGEWEIQQGRVSLTSSSGNGGGGHAGSGFGLHLVNVSKHLTTGGKSTSEVEAYFNLKLGKMTKYDSFMDFNVVLATEGLEAYKTAFKKDSVPFLEGTWVADGTTYTSIIVHVPNTQMVLELIQNSSLASIEGEASPHVLEQRVSSSALASYHASTVKMAATSSGSSVGAILTPVTVNRAASATAMAKLDAFYVTGMGVTKTVDSTTDNVQKKCYLWAGATVDVCFTSRPASSTAGDFSVEDFEDTLNAVHKNFLAGHPLCQMDKWEDNHYAIDSNPRKSANGPDTAKILAYVNTKKPYHVCTTNEGTALHYVWDPTGWAIQFDLTFSSAPDDCSSAFAAQSNSGPRKLQGSHTNPACTLDTSVCPSQSAEAAGVAAAAASEAVIV